MATRAEIKSEKLTEAGRKGGAAGGGKSRNKTRMSSIIEDPVDTSPEAIEDAERLRQAMEMRKAGATFQQIADRTGYSSRQAAHRAVSRALEKVEVHTPSELRAATQERIHSLITAVWANATNPQARVPGTTDQQTPSMHLAYLDRAAMLLRDLVNVFGLDDPSVRDAPESGLYLVGGTEEEYLRTVELLQQAKQAGEQLESLREGAVATVAKEVTTTKTKKKTTTTTKKGAA